jgi:hypothetical protein
MLEGSSVHALSISKLLLLALILLSCFAAGARAQNATVPSGATQSPAPSEAKPPALPQNPLPGTPSPAATPQAAAPGLPADLQACLRETGDYVTRGNVILYVIGITNTCDARLRCQIFANVTGAKGSSLGHTVMTLGPAASGAAAQQSHTMRVKAAGGTAQVSRDCKVF